MLQKSLDCKTFKKGCTTSKNNKPPGNQKVGTGPVCFFQKILYIKQVLLPNEPLSAFSFCKWPNSRKDSLALKFQRLPFLAEQFAYVLYQDQGTVSCTGLPQCYGNEGQRSNWC